MKNVNEEMIEVQIRKKEINVLVWLIPLISIIVAGWLIFKYYTALGPLVKIEFKNSGGLEPKRSIVKFRDVKVGIVEKVSILKNKEGVLVFVRMHKDMKPFLNVTTKFWVVKPEIGIGEVRGLDALLSGPYIQMYAKPIDFTKEKFKGLDEPPIDSKILQGKIISLISEDTYGLSEKLPVYYKHMKVGTLRKILLLKNGKFKIIISIQKKYAFLINNSTKFWNLKKIDLSLKDNRLQVALPGIKEIVFGGIAFETPFKYQKNDKKTFKLYSSKKAAYENRLGSFHKYVFAKIRFVNDNNSLLNIGDAVKFKGFKIGYIKNITSFFDYKQKMLISDVLIKFDLGAFGVRDIKTLLNKGLKAYVNNPLPFINNSYISFMFKGKSECQKEGKIYKIPFVKKKKASLIAKLSKFLDKLNSLPLEKSVNNFNNLIKTTTPNLNKMFNSVTKTSDSLKTILDENNKNLQKTFKNINQLSKNLNSLIKSYNQDSIFYDKASKTLYDLDKTLFNLNKFIDKLDKKPNSVIFGD